jgi:Tfp pilus assembly protein PilO
MNTKNILAIILFAISGILLYTFVLPFKAEGVDTVTVELDKLQSAYERASQQVALKNLRLKKQRLGTQELSILENFVPQDLRSGYFVYNLAQLANQNGLILKGRSIKRWQWCNYWRKKITNRIYNGRSL